MNAIIKNTKFDRNTTLCTLIGYFDEKGQYCESYEEGVLFSSLPGYVTKKVCPNHDITVQIAPKIDIVIFAKSICDIKQYIQIMGADHVKGLLDAFSKHNNPSDGRFWLTYDFPAK